MTVAWSQLCRIPRLGPVGAGSDSAPYMRYSSAQYVCTHTRISHRYLKRPLPAPAEFRIHWKSESRRHSVPVWLLVRCGRVAGDVCGIRFDGAVDRCPVLVSLLEIIVSPGNTAEGGIVVAMRSVEEPGSGGVAGDITDLVSGALRGPGASNSPSPAQGYPDTLPGPQEAAGSRCRLLDSGEFS
jgi:hypothetical protein